MGRSVFSRIQSSYFHHDKPNMLWLFWLVAVLIFFSTSLAQAQWSGQVVWVLDGDSLIVSHHGQKKRIRLLGIDSPEKGQPYADQAKKNLIQLVKNHRVTVLEKYSDKFGRTVAQITLEDGRNLNRTLVELGLAWRHPYFAKDPKLITLEAEAKKAGRGLWQEKNPTPPWVWKQQHKR
ncbi:MAG: thermonuclease family protein [Magnetococcales bacterium]|nr:thermonuclease family protein [Magnetococcales bacterium]